MTKEEYLAKLEAKKAEYRAKMDRAKNMIGNKEPYSEDMQIYLRSCERDIELIDLIIDAVSLMTIIPTVEFPTQESDCGMIPL